MITIKKLKSLKEPTRLRKATLLLKELSRIDTPDSEYVNELLVIIAELSDDERVGELIAQIPLLTHRSLLFALEDLHYRLLELLGGQTADWDFLDEEQSLDPSKRVIFERYLIIDRIRSPFNLGSIFRLADSFGIKKVYLVRGGADPLHHRSIKVSRATVETVDYEILDEEELLKRVIEYDLPIFALESGGVKITDFTFPPKGICVIGSEELGVSPTLLQLCDQHLGRVSIALGGTKGSLNVTSAAAIMLHRWFVQ